MAGDDDDEEDDPPTDTEVAAETTCRLSQELVVLSPVKRALYTP